MKLKKSMKVFNFFYIFQLILLFYLCLSSYSCNIGNEPESNLQFAIYRLEDEKIKWDEFLKIENKDTLKIEEFISPNMIDAYDFSSHVIYLNTEVPMLQSLTFPGVFIAMVNDKRCYYLSNWRIEEYMQFCHWTTIFPMEAHMMKLEFWGNYYKDIRNDALVLNALKSSGKYRGGIKLELDNIRSIFKQDSLYFEFSFTLTNIDNQNLYLIDPSDYWQGRNMTGMSYLHFWEKDLKIDSFFYVGVLSDLNQKHRCIGIPAMLSPNNLLYLKKGESIQRTFTVPKLNIPYGNLRCAFYYSGAMQATQTQITLTGGRVWIGNLFSNIIEVTISKERGLIITNKNVVLE